jgi:iron complex outermembrane recepter protein
MLPSHFKLHTMKNFFLSFSLLFGFIGNSRAQIAVYSPMNASFSDSITLYFNLNLSQDGRNAGLMNRNTGLYLWMGAGTPENPFAYSPAAQTDFSLPVNGAALTNIGVNLWQITLNPATWCRVPAGQAIGALGLIVKNADGTAQTENIILKSAGIQSLQQVVVKANKPFIEKQPDKTIMNIQNDLVAGGGTLFEAIQRAPGISVTNDENLVMSGKSGVQVYIDGRPSQLSDRDLANWLKASPAALVSTIEIITNPSGKYDAQGNAGIINIRLKKNTQGGFNGNLNSSYTQAQHYRANINTNLNYRQGKVNMFANAGYSHNLQHTDGRIFRIITEGDVQKTFDNQTVDIDRGISANLRLGADWFVNQKTTVGLLIRDNAYQNPMETPGITYMRSKGQLDSALRTANSNQYNTSNRGYNLNYVWRDTSGSEWNIDADFTRFQNANIGLIETDLLNVSGNKYGFTANDLKVNTQIDIFSFRADYSTTLKKPKIKLETGVKSALSATQNDMDAFYLENTGMQPDSGRTNDFNYREKVYAAYLNLKRQHGKWQYQVGLRGEYSAIEGRSENLDGSVISKPDTGYFNLFPSAFARYTLNDKNSLGLSGSRRINRPSYQDLNPFEYLYDNYTSEKGNPYLRPSYLTNLELNYNYRGALDVTLGHSLTSDYFQTVSEQNGNNATATPYNIGTQGNWFLNISLGLPVNDWWYSYNSLNSFYNTYKGSITEGEISTAAFGMGWYSNQSFSLKKAWKLQLSSWGSSGTSDALFKTSWLGSIDFGAAKSWAEGKWNVRLTILDMFNTQRWKQQVNFGEMQYTYLRKWESRGIRLQVNWKFGKTSFKARERSRGNEAEEGRIKTKS